MPDYRTLFDSKYVASYDLENGDVTVTISAVRSEELSAHNGDAERKAVLTFSDAKKEFVCVKTNCKLIAGMYGKDVDNWIGKRITLYKTQCEAFGDVVDCVRVRPAAPAAEAAA